MYLLQVTMTLTFNTHSKGAVLKGLTCLQMRVRLPLWTYGTCGAELPSTLCSLSVGTHAGMDGFPSGQTFEYCACLLGIPPFAFIIMFKIKCTIALVWVLRCHYTVGSVFSLFLKSIKHEEWGCHDEFCSHMYINWCCLMSWPGEVIIMSCVFYCGINEVGEHVATDVMKRLHIEHVSVYNVKHVLSLTTSPLFSLRVGAFQSCQCVHVFIWRWLEVGTIRYK